MGDSRGRSRYPALVAIATLACSTSPNPDGPSQVQRYGEGRYFVTYQSNFGRAKAKISAIRDANRYCEALGGLMEPIESETTGTYPVMTFEMIFTCQLPEAENPEPTSPDGGGEAGRVPLGSGRFQG